MSQHDMDLAAGNGAAVRADVNLALKALASNNSGAAEPATPYAYMWWPDTTAGIMKQRNAANTAWLNRWQLAGGELAALEVQGIWTPANTTGLTLYGTQNYTKIGNVVIAQFDVGWPSTADGGTATITGFPVNAKAVNFSCAIGYCGLGIIRGRLNAGTLTFSDTSGTDYTNAQMSLKEVAGTVTYLT